ncbi:MAG: phosphonate metabolism protein/1,5-bisphosphokinase (PRPP-forming) PhnN [Halofilum sp. (in: g-proteobacteria)]
MTSGRLIYLIGPSGVGKDTLLRAAAQQLAHRDDVRFPRRIITRPCSPHRNQEQELYEAADESAFQSLERRGEFLVTWRSHGLAYGLPVAIREDLAAGRDVVVNGSRGALPQARAAVARILPVYVWADVETLAERLRQRAREDTAGIERRLARGNAYAIPDDALVIDNSANLDDAIAALCRVLAEPADYHGRIA